MIKQVKVKTELTAHSTAHSTAGSSPGSAGAAGPGTRKRENYHHGDLRRDLLRVAREEIARHGAQAVSLTSLARLAGVSQPAPYRHFAHREALLEGVAAMGFEEFSATLDAALVDCAPLDRLRAIALAYVGFGEANIELYRLMFASRVTPEAITGSDLDAAASKAFAILRDLVAAAALSESVEDDAFLIWSQLHGLVMLKADGFIGRPLADYVRLLSL